jgi:hypothetical protein
MIQLAIQVAARPDGSTPDQTERWSDLKAAYRLFDTDDVSFQKIIEPHCRQTRADCRPGDVKLILNDTTELDCTSRRQTSGLGQIGNGGGRGFFIHSGLMVDAATGAIEGLAGQELFHRPLASDKTKNGKKKSKRRSPERASAVWGRLIEQIASLDRPAANRAAMAPFANHDHPGLCTSIGGTRRPSAQKRRRRTRLDHPLERLRKTSTPPPRNPGSNQKMWVILRLGSPSYILCNSKKQKALEEAGLALISSIK